MEQEKDRHQKPIKITVDNKHFDWLQPTITGNDIKKLVGAAPEYGVWLVVPGPDDDQEIDDHEKVDLTKPHHDRFITGPKKTTEGESSFLPSRDRAYLAEKSIKYEEIGADGHKGVVLRSYPLPTGQFDASRADILILLPVGYPDTPPDMFHLIPWVRLIAGNTYPRAADQSVTFAGQSWQRWSRHNTEWRPGVDGIWSMLKRVDHALKVAA